MIYWLPKNIPEIQVLPEDKKKEALKTHGKNIRWRFALIFLIVFVFLNQSVTVSVANYLPNLGTVMQALVIWLIEIPLLLFLLLPIYCFLLRRDINKGK